MPAMGKIVGLLGGPCNVRPFTDKKLIEELFYLGLLPCHYPTSMSQT
jgi:hypothetical protein